MADKRAYAKLDIGYFDNPKLIDLVDDHPAASLMHIASILYCAQHLTDGVVTPKAMQRKTGGTEPDATALIEAGLWHEAGHDCSACPEVPDGKVYVHDFLEHNRSASDAKRVTAKNAAAAHARWQKGDAERMRDASQTHAEPDADGNAFRMPRERERKKEETPSSPATPPMEFDSFWAIYPKKVAKQAALKAWTKATKHVDPETITAGAKRYAEFTANERTEKKFIKSPDGWLNAGRWEDDTEPAHTPNRPSPWDQLGVHI